MTPQGKRPCLRGTHFYWTIVGRACMLPNETWYCWWTKSCYCNHLVHQKTRRKKWEKLPTLSGVEFLNHLQHESFLFHPVSTSPLKVLGALLNCCFRQVMAFLEQLERNWLAEKKTKKTSNHFCQSRCIICPKVTIAGCWNHTVGPKSA